MEIDFSSQIKSAKRRGPKSSAQTPSKPEEKVKGSPKNPPGSAGTKPDAKEIAEKDLKKKDDRKLISSQADSIEYSNKIIEALKTKVEEHNSKYSKKVSLSQLKKVYRRGAGAFSQTHRPGKTRGQWAMARVNMFLRMMAGGKVKDAYRKADGDIARASEDLDFTEAWLPEEEDFVQAELDVDQYGINIDEFDVDADLFLNEDEGHSSYGYRIDI
jgi:hypothetical protein